MVSQEYKREEITKFVQNYHWAKLTSGQGLEAKEHWWAQPYSLLALFILGTSGVLAVLMGVRYILAMAPTFILGFAMVSHFDAREHIKPFLHFRSAWNFAQHSRDLAEMEQKLDFQIREIESANLSEQELTAFFQISLYGQVHGKETVEKILPELVSKYEGLRTLSFIKELAHDLKVA